MVRVRVRLRVRVRVRSPTPNPNPDPNPEQVGCVYTFGFIMMTPQLFINYKLKSTAHMPWKTFMYKALNTFVDDLFAFIIVMPTMHRLSCLRDDVVFLVYLYQRWAYGVDKKRANEYGQVEGDGLDADAAPHQD